MKLKYATIAVLITIGASTIFSIVNMLFPGFLRDMQLQRILSTSLYLARNVSLFIFFLILLKNQK